MSVLTLLPFSAAEAYGGSLGFIPDLFEKAPLFESIAQKPGLLEVIQRSTFPGRSDILCAILNASLFLIKFYIN